MRLSKEHKGKMTKSRWVLLLLFIVLIIVFWAVSNFDDLKNRILYKGYSRQATDLPGRVYELVDNVLHAPINYVRSTKNNFPNIYLDINFKKYQKLVSLRKQMLELGKIVRKPNDTVRALVSINKGPQMKVRVRLQGNGIDHLVHPSKWSLRLKLKGEDKIFGINEFAIVDLVTRTILSPFIFSMTAKLLNIDILIPKYKLVNLYINGDNRGIMLLEEHYTKHLAPRFSRPQSVIVKLDNGSEFKKNGKIYRNYTIHTFNSNLNSNAAKFKEYRIIATNLLAEFLNGKLAANEVFNVKSVGEYLALSDFFASWHSLNWSNLRFSYNPVTAKLEFIQNDVIMPRRAENIYRAPVSRETIITNMLHKDPLVKAAYQHALRRIADAVNNKDLIAKLNAYQEFILRQIHSELVFAKERKLNLFSKKIYCLNNHLVKECSKLRHLTSTHTVAIPKAYLPLDMNVFLGQSKKQDYVSLLNTAINPVMITGIRFFDASLTDISKHVFLKQKLPLILTGLTGDSSKAMKVFYQNTRSVKIALVKIKLKDIYGETKRIIARHKTGNIDYSNLVPNANLQELKKNFSFIKLSNVVSKKLVIRQGNYQINKFLIVPQGYTLNVAPGTTLSFAANTGIIAYGDLNMQGSAQQPIVLKGLSSNNKKPHWNGVFLNGGKHSSTWSYVRFKDLNTKHHQTWSLDAAITIYKGNIYIDNCSFENINAQYAINFINTKFSFENSVINNAKYSGISSEFSSGAIKDSSFIKIGTMDGTAALRFKKSKVMLQKIQIKNAFDQGIDVSEFRE